MPIRFRCAYCNQLMGIARRKAGSVVRCPKCAGEIIVPVPEGMDPQEAESSAAGGDQAFDVEPAFPEPAGAGPGTTVATPPPAAPSEPRPAPQPVPAPTPTPQRVGVFVPLGMLIISIGVVVLLLILMLVIGLIIGRASMSPDAKTAMLLWSATA